MTGRGKKAAAPKRKANGYKMPAPIPAGEVITDTIMKKKWRIGPSIGVGGFGEIYSACEHTGSPKKSASYPYVIKIEPHENGPLFVEKNFYMRNASKDEITKYMKSNKLTSLGMPTYFGNGSHDFKGEKYRYLVLERFGKDIWSIFKEKGRHFPPTTVFQLGLQMLEVLEYIHSRGYVHADIKGANILLGMKKGAENQAYLLDYGLATRVSEKEFKPDPKCAHNGTIEYTSRDAHLGVPTMRGDLEILGYNMLQWIIGELPWEKSLKQPKSVQTTKESFMRDVRSVTKNHKTVPEQLIQYFEYINTMKPKDTPDYAKCRQMFESYLKREGKNRNSKLDFSPDKKSKTNNFDNSYDSDATEEDSEETVRPIRKRKTPQTKKNTVKKGTKNNSMEDDDNCENGESPEKAKNIVQKVVKKRTKRNAIIDEDYESDEPADDKDKPQTLAQKAIKKRTKKNASEDDEDYENEEPTNTDKIEKAVKRRVPKRKSPEPNALINVKKTRSSPRATPPAKKNHANIATQTSVERLKRSPRSVSFDSPICEVIEEKSKREDSANSSGDIFEDSFTVTGKKVRSKRIIASEEETLEIVKKKVTLSKAKGRGNKRSPV